MFPKLALVAIAASLVSPIVAAPVSSPNAQAIAAAAVVNVAAKNGTVANGMLETWWHKTGEINTQTPVKDGNVRQSHLYNVKVMTVGASTWYNSFAYEAIPRSGNGQIFSPGNTTLYPEVPDGVTIEPSVGIDMAWSSFLYADDVVVKVTRNGMPITKKTQVVIRPTTLDYTVLNIKGAIYIVVPYSKMGSRFSVEFQDDLWTYYALDAGSESAIYVQDVNPDGVHYVPVYNDSMTVVGVEPHHGLLIFASPFPERDYVAAPEDRNTYIVKPGLVTSLESVTQSTVYFGPGVYWFTGTNEAILGSNVNWVYLAPGAYVKGAIKYQSTHPVIKATGFGVLSGEQYVYQANTALNYTNVKSDGTSLRMWSGTANAGQKWILSGPTITAPPFNTMDFFGDDNDFTTEVFDYKQVGCFFWQTDGLEVYPNSYHHDIFYHTNDDTIKAYYSDVLVERVVNWKINNDPIVQMGWTPRNISNIQLDDVTIIHARYLINDAVVVPALIGEAPNYLNAGSDSDANVAYAISNFTVNNMRCEGICPSLLRMNPLQNLVNFNLNNIYIEQFTPDSTGIDESFVAPFTDASGTPVHIDLTISNFYVGGDHITLAANNWQSDEPGRMNIDVMYWGQWTIV